MFDRDVLKKHCPRIKMVLHWWAPDVHIFYTDPCLKLWDLSQQLWFVNENFNNRL